MTNDASVRLAVVGLRGIPGVMGGIETHCEALYPKVLSLSNSLEVLIYARSPYVSSSNELVDRLKVISLWSPRTAGIEAFLHTFLAILHARFIAGVHCVHIHGIGPSVWCPLARLLGMKVLVTHHGKDYERDRWGFLARCILRLGESCALRFSNRVICVSPVDASEFSRTHPESASRVTYIPNGAELPAVTSTEDSVLGKYRLRRGRYLLAVGRLVPEKALDQLVAAFRPGPDIDQLVIAGDADHQSAYSRRLLSMASPSVRFLGRVSRDELASMYASTACFVLPSRHEGLPIVALEAIASGAPILMSDIPANVAIGLPAKHYFPVNDVEALEKLLATGDFEDLRVDPAQYLGRFDWNQIACSTVQVIKDVAGV